MSQSKSVPICLLALALLVGSLWASRPRDQAPRIAPPTNAPAPLPEVAASAPPLTAPETPVATGPIFPTLSPPTIGDNAPKIPAYVPSPVTPPSYFPMDTGPQPASVGFGGPGIGVGGR